MRPENKASNRDLVYVANSQGQKIRRSKKFIKGLLQVRGAGVPVSKCEKTELLDPVVLAAYKFEGIF